MNKLILAGAAALAFTIPAAAQQTTTTTTTNSATNTDQSMEGWPDDRRTAFETWPENYRTYYWTLTPSQQNGWWLLNDEQRARIFAMTPEERATNWASIERQIASMPSANASATAQAATTAAATASTMGGTSVSSAVRATNPSGAKDYPLCSRTITDSCINPREAGKNYGNRPLKHWPGRPASEIPGKKPQN